MMGEPQKEKWAVETYLKIVTSVTSLATGALVLPIVFLRDFIGVARTTALWPFLSEGRNLLALLSWCCLGLSIVSGLAYSWVAVNWVKWQWGTGAAGVTKAAQRQTRLNVQRQTRLDVLFVMMIALFLLGVLLIIVFFLIVTPRQTGLET